MIDSLTPPPCVTILGTACAQKWCLLCGRYVRELPWLPLVSDGNKRANNTRATIFVRWSLACTAISPVLPAVARPASDHRSQLLARGSYR